MPHCSCKLTLYPRPSCPSLFQAHLGLRSASRPCCSCRRLVSLPRRRGSLPGHLRHSVVSAQVPAPACQRGASQLCKRGLQLLRRVRWLMRQPPGQPPGQECRCWARQCLQRRCSAPCTKILVQVGCCSCCCEGDPSAAKQGSALAGLARQTAAACTGGPRIPSPETCRCHARMAECAPAAGACGRGRHRRRSRPRPGLLRQQRRRSPRCPQPCKKRASGLHHQGPGI